MPGIMYQPISRRSLLRLGAWGAAAIVTPDQLLGESRRNDEFHLALLSDTHVPGDRQNGHRGFNPWANLQRIVPDLVAIKPQGVIINGDAARLEGRPGDYLELKRLLEPLAADTPVYIGLGNHDDRANFFKTFPAPPGARQKIADKHVVVVEHPVVRIVVLDSLLYVNKAAGLLGKSQRQWLARFLAGHADRPVVCFVHHTLQDGDGDLLDVDRLFGILRPHRHMKAIFFGHSHVWEIKERQGVRLINLPATGYNFSDEDPVGWVDARFNSGGVRLALHAIAGNITKNGQVVEVKWT